MYQNVRAESPQKDLINAFVKEIYFIRIFKPFEVGRQEFLVFIFLLGGEATVAFCLKVCR